MLSVPTVSTMLTIIGLALFATVGLIVLLGLLLGRAQPAPKLAAPVVRIPAQRQGDHKTPVASH